MPHAVNTKRPVNLDLTKFHFPLPAITSILHRVSGVIMFFALAVLLYMLDSSLESRASFQELSATLDNFFVKIIVWLILAAFIYHFVAGVKHLIMDMGYFETLHGGFVASQAVLVISIVLIVLAGVLVW